MDDSSLLVTASSYSCQPLLKETVFSHRCDCIQGQTGGRKWQNWCGACYLLTLIPFLSAPTSLCGICFEHLFFYCVITNNFYVLGLLGMLVKGFPTPERPCNRIPCVLTHEFYLLQHIHGSEPLRKLTIRTNSAEA